MQLFWFEDPIPNAIIINTERVACNFGRNKSSAHGLKYPLQFMSQVQKVPLISFELILIFLSWRFGSVTSSLQCDHANNNKSGFNKVLYSDTSTTLCSSHQADSSQWQDQLRGNVNLRTLIKHENLQRTSSKRLVSLRAAFWKSSGECNTFGCFPEYLHANKSLLIRVFRNATIPLKKRSWYKLPVVQHFFPSPAAPWKGSHSQSHKAKLQIPHQVPKQIHHSYTELYHYPRKGPLCREYRGISVIFVLSPARQVPSSRV